MRAVGLFADAVYYPSLVAVINSILYYGVDARIKFYDFHGLPHLLKTYLSGYAEVVAVPETLFSKEYYDQFYFRPRILNAVGIEEHEILIDVDTVVLSDLEDIFREVEKGRVVVLKEWDYLHADARDAHRDVPEDSAYIYRRVIKQPDAFQDLPEDSIFHRILKHPEAYKDGLRIYNGGLLGFNRKAHEFIIDLWAQSTRQHDYLKNTFFVNDQNNLSLILASLRKEDRIALRELPKDLWMQTWSTHREPRKLLGFEDGRVALYNGATGRRMKFYHYTGDIVAPVEASGKQRSAPVRFNYLLSDAGLPEDFTRAEMIAAWHDVWRRRHETPAGELPMFFYNAGPLRVPQCMDSSWRESLARILRSTESDAAIQKDSRETWALALAYDYIDYCGYRGLDLGWLAGPLSLLLDADAIKTGERTISWDGATDVAIAFRPRYEDVRDWISAERNFSSGYSERHKGVFLSIN
jgi:hypothetical protein